MGKVLEFPRSRPAAVALNDPTDRLRRAYLRHIDEVFDDYAQRRASLSELADHVKSIVGRLVGKNDRGDLS